MMTTLYEREMQDKEMARLFAQEELIEEATELVACTMKRKGITKSELAQRIGTTKAHITQLLAGSRNMTLRTLADLMHAMDTKVALSSISQSHPQDVDAMSWTLSMPRSRTQQEWGGRETFAGAAGHAA